MSAQPPPAVQPDEPPLAVKPDPRLPPPLPPVAQQANPPEEQSPSENTPDIVAAFLRLAARVRIMRSDLFQIQERLRMTNFYLFCITAILAIALGLYIADYLATKP